MGNKQCFRRFSETFCFRSNKWKLLFIHLATQQQSTQVRFSITVFLSTGSLKVVLKWRFFFCEPVRPAIASRSSQVRPSELRVERIFWKASLKVGNNRNNLVYLSGVSQPQEGRPLGSCQKARGAAGPREVLPRQNKNGKSIWNKGKTKHAVKYLGPLLCQNYEEIKETHHH